MKTALRHFTTKSNSKLLSWVAASLILSGLCLAGTNAKDGNFNVVSLCDKAKVNMKQAEKTALSEVPGRVRRIELELDDGVLIYEIVICQGKTKKEVKVDANSGKILEIDKKLGKCKEE